MTLYNITTGLTDWLNASVCPLIALKKPNNKDDSRYRLVNPTAYPAYPLPVLADEFGIASIDAPMIIVSPLAGSDESAGGIESGKVTVAFNILVWSQGISEDGQPTQINSHGWEWLCNIIDILRREIKQKNYFDGLQLQYPLKYDLYPDKEDNIFPNGYYNGSVTADFTFNNDGCHDYDEFLQ